LTYHRRVALYTDGLNHYIQRMQINATSSVIGVNVTVGMLLLGEPGFSEQDFATVAAALSGDRDVAFDDIEYAETPSGGAVWWVPFPEEKPSLVVVDLTERSKSNVKH